MFPPSASESHNKLLQFSNLLTYVKQHQGSQQSPGAVDGSNVFNALYLHSVRVVAIRMNLYKIFLGL